MSTQTLWKTLGIDRSRFRFADGRLDRSGLIAAVECCRTVAPTESSDTSPHWGPGRSPTRVQETHVLPSHRHYRPRKTWRFNRVTDYLHDTAGLTNAPFVATAERHHHLCVPTRRLIELLNAYGPIALESDAAYLRGV